MGDLWLSIIQLRRVFTRVSYISGACYKISTAGFQVMRVKCIIVNPISTAVYFVYFDNFDVVYYTIGKLHSYITLHSDVHRISYPIRFIVYLTYV